MHGHSGPIRQLVFLNDKTIISAADDGTMRTWNAAARAKLWPTYTAEHTKGGHANATQLFLTHGRMHGSLLLLLAMHAVAAAPVGKKPSE